MDDLLKPALESLRSNQQRLDMDGCVVGVSRQALDEVLAHVEQQAAEIERLRSRDWIGEMLTWKGKRLFLGELRVGKITDVGPWWNAVVSNDIIDEFPTEAEARAAVERAVREALIPKEGDGK